MPSPLCGLRLHTVLLVPGSSTDISEDWEKDFDLDMTEEEVQVALSKVDASGEVSGRLATEVPARDSTAWGLRPPAPLSPQGELLCLFQGAGDRKERGPPTQALALLPLRSGWMDGGVPDSSVSESLEEPLNIRTPSRILELLTCGPPVWDLSRFLALETRQCDVGLIISPETPFSHVKHGIDHWKL